MRSSLATVAGVAFFAACTTSKSDNATPDSLAATLPDSARPIASPGGFTQPEAVRYDPDQDVYFVSNFGTGDASAKDNNGFISRMTPNGKVEQLKFIAAGARTYTPRREPQRARPREERRLPPGGSAPCSSRRIRA
jgi:hypothetical protein